MRAKVLDISPIGHAFVASCYADSIHDLKDATMAIRAAFSRSDRKFFDIKIKHHTQSDKFGYLVIGEAIAYG